MVRLTKDAEKLEEDGRVALVAAEESIVDVSQRGMRLSLQTQISRFWAESQAHIIAENMHSYSIPLKI